MVPGFDYYGLNAGGGCVKRFDRVSNAYAEVSKLQNALEQMRRSVILYGQNGAPELVNEVYKFQALAERQASETRAKPPEA
jgi:hypothetical protein